MGISELLVQLADPQAIKTLSFMEKMAGGLLVTFLGMGITFLALILLQIIIDLLARIMVKLEKQPEKKEAARAETSVGETIEESGDEEELVAVITAAVALQMQRATGNIVIRDIRRLETSAPLWHNAGILDQMNTRL